jgi:3-hydroxyisobutyrate dehydrogenase-like beta-hydroxyacid dehydrogenase
MTTAVGIFGLGLIGLAAAKRLIAAGYSVIGHDPDATACSALTALGGSVAAADEVWACPCVLLAVFDAAQARSVLAAAPRGTRSDVLVLTTSDPVEIASLVPVSGAGIALVEAPVSGTSAQLRRGGATLYLAGDPAAIARLDAIAKALSDRVVRIGPFGQGARVKLAINLILGLNRAALAEGLLLARALGLDPATLLELAQGSAAASAVMATKGARMVTGDFAPEGRVAQSAKDFGLILHAASAAGIELPFARTYHDLMTGLVDAGDGGLDNSAIIRALERGRNGPAETSETRR